MPSALQFSLPLEPPASIRTGLAEIMIPPTSRAAGKQIVELELPKEVVIMMIARDKYAFIPTGRSFIHPHDKLLVFADTEMLRETMKIIDGLDPYPIPGPRGDGV